MTKLRVREIALSSAIGFFLGFSFLAALIFLRGRHKSRKQADQHSASLQRSHESIEPRPSPERGNLPKNSWPLNAGALNAAGSVSSILSLGLTLTILWCGDLHDNTMDPLNTQGTVASPKLTPAQPNASPEKGGIESNLSRLLALTARRHDIETQERSLTERKMFLSQRLSQLLFSSLYYSVDPRSPAARFMNAQQRVVEEEEKRTDILLRRLQSEKKDMLQEAEALDRVITGSTQSFGLMARGI